MQPHSTPSQPTDTVTDEDSRALPAPVVGRRAVLGVASIGATALLAGCAGGSGGSGAYGGGATTPSTTPATTPATGGASTPPSGSGTVLVSLSDVPVDGGVSAQTADGQPVLVTQPTAGTVKAFSAICTHKGCTVAPKGSQLMCPCHGSVYDLATGDVVSGPAPAPLPSIDVRVKSGDVVTA